MAASENLQLNPDEFAFHFVTETGVSAKELGVFLQRAAVVARGQGADLRVIGIRAGSVDVVVQAVKRAGNNVGAEFAATPVKTTAASIAIVTAVVAGIAHVMSPASGTAAPLAKSGADIVEKSGVTRIDIVSQRETTVVMDRGIAKEIRQIERRRERQEFLPPREVQALIRDGRGGELTGSVIQIETELHFRPDGYRYTVPIDMYASNAADYVFAGGHFKVRADLMTKSGLPDSIIIHEARDI